MPPVSARTPEGQAILRARQAALTALTKHPSWPELEAEVERKIEMVKKRLMALAFSGGEKGLELPQRQVDYLRGWVDGIQMVFKVPTMAEQSLERFLQQQAAKEGAASDETD